MKRIDKGWNLNSLAIEAMVIHREMHVEDSSRIRRSMITLSRANNRQRSALFNTRFIRIEDNPGGVDLFTHLIIEAIRREYPKPTPLADLWIQFLSEDSANHDNSTQPQTAK